MRAPGAMAVAGGVLLAQGALVIPCASLPLAPFERRRARLVTDRRLRCWTSGPPVLPLSLRLLGTRSRGFSVEGAGLRQLRGAAGPAAENDLSSGAAR